MKHKSPRLPKRFRGGAVRVTNKQGLRVWALSGREYPTLRDVAHALSKQTQDVHPFL
jgi:hypothetical protein